MEQGWWPFIKKVGSIIFKAAGAKLLKGKAKPAPSIELYIININNSHIDGKSQIGKHITMLAEQKSEGDVVKFKKKAPKELKQRGNDESKHN